LIRDRQSESPPPRQGQDFFSKLLEDFQTNLIMPEPCPFLNRKFPAVSIIRPTSTGNSGAVATANAFVADGLFKGQTNPDFIKVFGDLAEEADEARRRC
jgi:hypothetical protein